MTGTGHDLTLRCAQPEDLEEVFALYRAAIRNLDQAGIPQWDEVYPDRATLTEDIRRGEMTLAFEQGRLAAVFTLNEEYDPDYQQAAWNWPDAPFLVLHRLCVHPDFQNRGVGRRTMAAMEEAARSRGARTIRLDAFTRNPHSLRMYEGLGYQKTGETQWRKGLFYLYEKKL